MISVISGAMLWFGGATLGVQVAVAAGGCLVFVALAGLVYKLATQDQVPEFSQEMLDAYCQPGPSLEVQAEQVPAPEALNQKGRLKITSFYFNSTDGYMYLDPQYQRVAYRASQADIDSKKGILWSNGLREFAKTYKK